MTKETTATDATEPAGVIGKLKAHKAAHGDHVVKTLPETGVTVRFPAFRKHGDWQRTMRRNKGDVAKAQIDYATSVCTFDGERLTVTDWHEYMPMTDANELLAALFAGDDDGDDDEAGSEGKR